MDERVNYKKILESLAYDECIGLSEEDNLAMGHRTNDISNDKYINIPHIHRYYEVFYNISGANAYMTDSRFFECGEYDLIVVPPWQVHRVIVSKGIPYNRSVIYYNNRVLDILESLHCPGNVLSWLRADYGNFPQKITLTAEQHKAFELLISDGSAAFKDNRFLDLFGVFLQIVTCFEKWFENADCSRGSYDKNLSYAEKAVRVIEEDFRTATVSQIASRIAVNRDYLNRVFKDKWGISIGKYLIIRRLMEAKKHLCLGKSAKEACYLSGFKDYTNFLRTFKNYEGYSPNYIDEDPKRNLMVKNL